jgi:hypothetical protein
MKKSFYTFLTAFLVFWNAAIAQTDPSEPVLIINNGDHYTKDAAVDLDLKAKGAVYMMISNTRDFNGMQWGAYQEFVENWQLTPGDGEKMVYAKIKDASGNESKVLFAKIILDTEPPLNPFLSIYQGAVTNDPSLIVDIELKAEGAQFMMLSNNKSFYGQRWQIYRPNYDGWELEPGEDGVRSVFVKFKDAAQNESEIVGVTINVDTKAPFGGSVVINRGDPFTIQQDRKVSVAIFGRGADSMMVSLDPKFAGAEWELYDGAEREMVLEGEDGKKTVYVKFKDLASNTSPIYTDEIVIDTTPPRDCSVVIEGGAESTNHYDKKVTLEFRAEGAVFVKISNKESFYGAQWQQFRPKITGWSLEGEDDGEKTVYVKFKDQAGNVSSVFSDSIILKRSN